MDPLADIIKKRLPPGILIFDLQERLSYANLQALEMLVPTGMTKGEEVPVPEEIHCLCRAVRKNHDPLSGEEARAESLIIGNTPCAVRAFLLGSAGGQIMVLMEGIVEKHQVDLEKARREFRLSKREADVVTHICQGLANRDISEKLFISEYTVKDHIKNIMKKMAAGSRNEIISFLR